VNGYVATTDHHWFTFLRTKRPDEVNFWQPSGRGFHVIQPGEPLFFKLKNPHNAIGGFGLFARHALATATLAWEAFGELNGARSFGEMCARIEKYRPGQERDPRKPCTIGCVMLSQPVFFDDADWVDQPRDWAPNTVSGARYDLTVGEGRRIWEACRARAAAVPLIPPVASEPAAQAERYGTPVLMRPRLGQGTFRVAVTQAYGTQCAVSHEHSLPVLEAAHIQAYNHGGPHDVTNGLLLRADIHRLFDRGYVTITPELRFEVSSRLREEWENGKVYYEMRGNEVSVPSARRDRPSSEFLRWHNEHVFEKGIAA
jgi:putative restriction endonuclease